MNNTNVTLEHMSEEYRNTLPFLNKVLEDAYEFLNVPEAFTNGSISQGWSLSRPNDSVVELLDDAKDVVKTAVLKLDNLDSKFSEEEKTDFLDRSSDFFMIIEEFKNQALNLETEINIETNDIEEDRIM